LLMTTPSLWPVPVMPGQYRQQAMFPAHRVCCAHWDWSSSRGKNPTDKPFAGKFNIKVKSKVPRREWFCDRMCQ
jgi:hypothetical protein